MTAAETNTWEILDELGFTIKKHSDKKHSDRNEINCPNTIYAQYSSPILPKIRLDFALPSAKIAIEVQGDFWHATDESEHRLTLAQVETKQRDNYKQNLLRLRQWNLIVIHEKDVMQKREKAKNHLESSIFSLILV